MGSTQPKQKRYVQHKTAEDLINSVILPELIQGRGCVPLIGSGFSAPSGLPIIRDLHLYLQECVALALGVAVHNHGCRPWNPRIDNWPPFSQMHRPTSEGEWLKRFQEALAANTTKINSIREQNTSSPQISRLYYRNSIIQEGLGAIAEWRSALIFLSRLLITADDGSVFSRKESNSDSSYRLTLSNPDARVIDRCFDEALAGKDPTIGHRMLGLLSVPLHTNVILTTNFDDLLERAFMEAQNPLRVSAVQMGNSLPPYPSNVGERVLIKMHGDRHSLRADYSLDAMPFGEDRKNFVSYFATAIGRRHIIDAMDGDLRHSIPSEKNLWIIGHSLFEPRTVAFIRAACKHLDEHFKIIFIGYSEGDIENYKKIALHLSKTKAEFHSLHYPQSGQLLLLLFQFLRRSLPSWGVIFPSTSRLALPHLPDKNAKTQTVKDQANEISIRLSQAQPSGDQQGWRRLLLCAPKRIHGATSIFVRVFDFFHREGVCLWIDMTHIGSTMDLFEKILDAYHYQSGRENWKPTRVGLNDHVEAAKMLAAEIQRSRRTWFIFYATSWSRRRRPSRGKLPAGCRIKSSSGRNRIARKFDLFMRCFCCAGPGTPASFGATLSGWSQILIHINPRSG